MIIIKLMTVQSLQSNSGGKLSSVHLLAPPPPNFLQHLLPFYVRFPCMKYEKYYIQYTERNATEQRNTIYFELGSIYLLLNRI